MPENEPMITDLLSISDPAKTVLVIGGFDPMHGGHVRLLQRASEYGRVVVALYEDDYLIDKKGYVFMPFTQRHDVLFSVRHVWFVVPIIQSITHVINELQPDYLVSGGKRPDVITPEIEACQAINARLIFNAGQKVADSEELVEVACRRLWGR